MGRYRDLIRKRYDITPSDEKRDEAFSEYLDTRKKIEEEFCRLTDLDKTDIKFLLFASILQTARWIILGGTLGEKIEQDARVSHDDPETKRKIKDKQNEYKDKYFDKHDTVKKSEKKYRSCMEIVMTTKVPYDATRNAAAFGLNMEGKYHRVHTLGHDPILGYIFGTFNILTDTMTIPNFRSFNVDMNGLKIESETTIFNVLRNGIESIKEDVLRLPAAIFAQSLHLKSDEYTKTGLPIPILSTFNEDIASKIYKEGYDKLCFSRDLKTIGKQYVFSILIDMIIALIHGLYYDEKKHIYRSLYEIKTRKILLYSSIIASCGNLLFTLFTKNFKYLDIGGFISTAEKIIANESYMVEIEKEFIEKKLYEKYSSEIKELDKKIEANLNALGLSI